MHLHLLLLTDSFYYSTLAATSILFVDRQLEHCHVSKIVFCVGFFFGGGFLALPPLSQPIHNNNNSTSSQQNDTIHLSINKSPHYYSSGGFGRRENSKRSYTEVRMRRVSARNSDLLSLQVLLIKWMVNVQLADLLGAHSLDTFNVCSSGVYVVNKQVSSFWLFLKLIISNISVAFWWISLSFASLESFFKWPFMKAQ